jgi:RNA polymerase sigma-70 factor (ECF subfamily)
MLTTTLSWIFAPPSSRDEGQGRSRRAKPLAVPVEPTEPWSGVDVTIDGSAAPTAEEHALADRMRAGDVDAFRTLFDRHYTELVAHAYRYVRQTAIAEELVQDVFLRVWERRAGLPSALRPRAYLYASVRNAALKAVRRDVLETHARGVAAVEVMAAPLDIAGSFDRTELHTALSQAIAGLPDRLRAVVELRWGRQLRIVEVASSLGITPKAVETYITRSVKALRAALAQRPSADE